MSTDDLDMLHSSSSVVQPQENILQEDMQIKSSRIYGSALEAIDDAMKSTLSDFPSALEAIDHARYSNNSFERQQHSNRVRLFGSALEAIDDAMKSTLSDFPSALEAIDHARYSNVPQQRHKPQQRRSNVHKTSNRIRLFGSALEAIDDAMKSTLSDFPSALAAIDHACYSHIKVYTSALAAVDHSLQRYGHSFGSALEAIDAMKHPLKKPLKMQYESALEMVDIAMRESGGTTTFGSALEAMDWVRYQHHHRHRHHRQHHSSRLSFDSALHAVDAALSSFGSNRTFGSALEAIDAVMFDPKSPLKSKINLSELTRRASSRMSVLDTVRSGSIRPGSSTSASSQDLVQLIDDDENLPPVEKLHRNFRAAKIARADAETALGVAMKKIRAVERGGDYKFIEDAQRLRRLGIVLEVRGGSRSQDLVSVVLEEAIMELSALAAQQKGKLFQNLLRRLRNRSVGLAFNALRYYAQQKKTAAKVSALLGGYWDNTVLRNAFTDWASVTSESINELATNAKRAPKMVTFGTTILEEEEEQNPVAQQSLGTEQLIDTDDNNNNNNNNNNAAAVSDAEQELQDKREYCSQIVNEIFQNSWIKICRRPFPPSGEVRIYLSAHAQEMQSIRAQLRVQFAEIEKDLRQRCGLRVRLEDVRWGLNAGDQTPLTPDDLRTALSLVMKCDIFIGIVGSLGGIAQPVVTSLEKNAKFSGLLEQEVRTAAMRSKRQHPRLDPMILIGIDEEALNRASLSTWGVRETPSQRLRVQRLRDWLNGEDKGVVLNYRDPSIFVSRIREEIDGMLESWYSNSIAPLAPQQPSPSSSSSSLSLSPWNRREECLIATQKWANIWTEEKEILTTHVKKRARTLPIVITSPAGCGRTSLLANWLAELKDDKSQSFIIATNLIDGIDHANIEKVLMGLFLTLGRQRTMKKTIEVYHHNIVEQFPSLCKTFASPRPLLLIIEMASRSIGNSNQDILRWLPEPHPNISVILSVNCQQNDFTSESSGNSNLNPVLQAACSRRWNVVRLQDISKETCDRILSESFVSWGNSTETTAAAIASSSLLQHLDTMTNPSALKLQCIAQLASVMYASSSVATPSSLSITSHTSLEMCINALLTSWEQVMNVCFSANPDETPSWVMEVIDSDEWRSSIGRNQGESIVGRALSLICCARTGMTRAELNVLHPLPKLTFLRLERLLDPFLSNREGYMVISSWTFRNVVRQRYKQGLNTHTMLASFFSSPDAPSDRKVVELPFHLKELGAWDLMCTFLGDAELFATLMTQEEGIQDALSYWKLPGVISCSRGMDVFYLERISSVWSQKTINEKNLQVLVVNLFRRAGQVDAALSLIDSIDLNKMGDMKPVILLSKAKLYYAQGKYDYAIDWSHIAQDAIPQNEWSSALMLDCLDQLASSQKACNMLDDAAGTMNAMVAIEEIGLYQKAIQQIQRDRSDDADIDDKWSSSYARILLNLGTAHAVLNNTITAITLIEEAIDMLLQKAEQAETEQREREKREQEQQQHNNNFPLTSTTMIPIKGHGNADNSSKFDLEATALRWKKVAKILDDAVKTQMERLGPTNDLTIKCMRERDRCNRMMAGGFY